MRKWNDVLWLFITLFSKTIKWLHIKNSENKMVDMSILLFQLNLSGKYNKARN